MNFFGKKPLLTWKEFVIMKWGKRYCFVCGKLGICDHRERSAESLIEYEAALQDAPRLIDAPHGQNSHNNWELYT